MTGFPRDLLMFKSQLQEYAQKAGLPAPVYETVREGPSHEPHFKASVTLQDVTYESPPGFTNLKKAEHAAAEVALEALAKSSNGSTVLPGPVHESGLCKNLLQEYAQKCRLPLPVYRSERSGEIHSPVFSSTVEIAGVQYKGGVAKNKKEAEIKAAKTALLAILFERGSQASGNIQGSTSQGNSAEAAFANLINSYSELRGKKRGRAGRSISGEPASGKSKVDHQQTVKKVNANAKDSSNAVKQQHANNRAGLTSSVDIKAAPLVHRVKQQHANNGAGLTSSVDIKAAPLVHTVSSLVENSGFAMSSHCKMQQEPQQPMHEQGQNLSEVHVKEQHLQASAT